VPFENGLPLWWENYYFGATGQDPNARAPRGDGLTILQAYQQGVNPIDYYDGTLPVLAKVSGDGQGGQPGRFLEEPLVVRVYNATTGVPFANAPITFSVSPSGELATHNSGNPPANVQLSMNTDDSGFAAVYFMPSNIDLSSVTATAITPSAQPQITFTVNDITKSSPPFLQTQQDSETQSTLTWTNSATNQTGYTVERWTFATGWQIIALLNGNATAFQDADVPIGAYAGYRITATNGDGKSQSSSLASANGTDPYVTDTDSDGLTDAQEIAIGTNPDEPDTDGDGIPDGEDGWPLDPNMHPDRLPDTKYAVLSLSNLGLDYAAYLMNDSGQFVGYVNQRFVLWDITHPYDRTPIPIDPFALNNNGVVVGSDYDGEGIWHTEIWSASTGRVFMSKYTAPPSSNIPKCKPNPACMV